MEFNAKGYWETRLKEHWGLHGVGYVSYSVHYNQWLYRVRKRVFIDHVRALNPNFEQAKVLDIGSGTGFYLDLWKSLGVKSITGSDITDISVGRLKELYPGCSIVQLDIGRSLEEQGFAKNRFDVITAFDVLFHILDDNCFRNAILNISQLLVPGGYFIFSGNFVHGKAVRGIHQVSRPIEEITRLLGEAGLRTIKRVPMFVLMNAPVDTDSRWQLPLWRLLMSPVRVINLLGFFYGAVLFPLEVFLTKVLKESPTTEMMICQKRK